MTSSELPEEPPPDLPEFAPVEADGSEDRNDGFAAEEQDSGLKSNLALLIEATSLQHRRNATSFSRWLGIPDKANYLRPVLKAFSNRLPLVETIANLESLPLPEMLSENGLAQALKGFKDNWAFRDCFKTSDKRGDPTFGVQTDHPFYAMHPYHPVVPELEGAYDQLQAQFIVGAITCWDESEDSYRHGVVTLLSNAAVSLRHCAKSPAMAYLPAQALCRTDYIVSIENLVNHPESRRDVTEESKEQLRRILLFLKTLDDDESDGYVELATPSATLSPKGADVPFRVSIRRSATLLTHSEKKWIAYSGLAPDELTRDVEYVVFEPDPETPKPTRTPETPPSLAVQVHVREYLNGAIERSNQNLPLSWNRLLPHEIAAFLHCATGEAIDIVGRARKWTSNPARVESAALLMVMFWLSRPLETCVELVAIPSLESIAPGSLPEQPGYIVKEKLWYVPAARPKAAPSYARAARELAEPTSPFVLLPVPAAVVPFLERLPKVISAEDEISGIFSTDPIELRNRAEDVLRVVAKSNPRRFTQSRLDHAVFWAIAEATGDVAIASLCLGRTHRSSDTALHYACPDRDIIATTYTTVCATMIGAVQGELAHLGLLNPQVTADSPPPAPLLDSQFEGRVGVPICPTPETVQRLRRDVGDAFKKTAASPGTPGFLIEHHNLLTLYTVCMMKVATGYRDIKSPLPRRDDIDFEDNTILISDKDDAASFGTRIIPLVDTLRQQLIFYDDHIRTLASRIALSSPKLAADLFRQFGLSRETVARKTQPGGHDSEKSEKEAKLNAPEATPPLFFLHEKNGQLDFEKVRPKVLSKELASRAPWFQLPTNLNRSYLRRQLALPKSDELKTAPCSPESISYLLSHWTRGRQPLGMYATRPLDSYLQDLAPRLAEIVLRDGWVPMKGLG